jgi:hypothetical protein
MSAPFPSRRAAERGVILGFVIGTLALTATFGLRTAVFQTDYSAGSDQLGVLAVHGMAECVAALLLGFLALLPRRKGVSTAILVLAALVIPLAKAMFLAVLVAIGEPDPWSYSLGIFALCAAVSLPLILSFLPVTGAVFAARASNAHDGALQVRATLCVWLAAAGLAAVVLGPDLAVRAWGLVVVGGAALHVAIGAADERRLLDWARGAVARGAPVYFIENEAPKDDVPSVYAGDARKAAILTAAEDAGSYRRDPSRRPIAAVDLEALNRPRRFVDRIVQIGGIPLVLTLLAIGIGWLVLHPTGLAPRAVTLAFQHYRVKPYSGHSLPGLSLWAVERGGDYVVGYDPETRRVVQEAELFHRVRGVPVERLADLANAMLYNGNCCVLKGSDPGWPKDTEGRQPRAPYVQDGKLVFWRKWEDKVYRFEAPVEEGMLSSPGVGPSR